MHRLSLSSLLAFSLVVGMSACNTGVEQQMTTPPAGDAPMAPDQASTDQTPAAASSTAESAASGETPAATAPGAAAGTAAAPVAPAEAGAMLQKVKDRGTLVCGVNDQVPGFGSLTSTGDYAGFDIDFCRAIAAAIFGDAQAVEFKPLTAQQRFTALQTGEVDVLIRNTTWTLSRDTQNGLDFGPTTFYDGQGIMVRADSGAKDIADLAGASICVTSGTTTEKNLEDAMSAAQVEYTPVVQETADTLMSTYDQGRCDAVTADRSALVSRQTTLTDPTAHEILNTTLSKEPLGPAVLQGDPQWRDIVDWVVFGIIAAEELGITSKNLDESLASENPEVRRFLGLEDKLGEGLGLSNDYMVKVLQAVGNYGQIYDRNLGVETTINLDRGVNTSWRQGGLLYSPPFR